MLCTAAPELDKRVFGIERMTRGGGAPARTLIPCTFDALERVQITVGGLEHIAVSETVSVILCSPTPSVEAACVQIGPPIAQFAPLIHQLYVSGGGGPTAELVA